MNTATLTAPARLTLEQLLNVDGVTCLLTGILLTLAAAPLAGWLGVPQALLFWAGVVLLPCAALMFITARRPAPALVWLVIGGNIAWALASVLVALAWFTSTPFGLAFILVQALVVAVLAALEWRAFARR